MTLTGEYTQAGAQLAAQIQAGLASLTLTRAVAGPGTTAAHATAMASEKQTLALGAHSLSGTTLTVPVQLFSVDAAESYAMREIGLFALDAEDEEVLYKLYRFDQAVSVSPLCSLTATFYLNDTVAAGSQPTVQVAAQGLLTQEDVPDIIAQTLARGVLTNADVPGIISQTLAKGVLTNANIPAIVNQATDQTIAQIGERKGDPVYPNETITCTTSNLLATIAGLSKRVYRNVKIEVTPNTDISTSYLEVSGFFGTGELMITCTSQVTVAGIRVHGNKNRRITLDNFRAGGSGLSISAFAPNYLFAMIFADGNNLVDLRRCTVIYTGGSDAQKIAGVYAENSHCILTNYLAKDIGVSIMGQRLARINVRSFSQTGSHNVGYVFRLFNGSMLTWPGAASTLSGQTSCSTYSVASGAVVLFSPNTVEIGSGFTSTEY